MYSRDWIDQVHWTAILLGVLVALLLQIIATLLVVRPFAVSLGWSAVVVVELCVAIGAFIGGWRAQEGALINALGVAFGSAVLSLVATLIYVPAEVDLFSVLFLFGTFACVGVLSGLLATVTRTRTQER